MDRSVIAGLCFASFLICGCIQTSPGPVTPGITPPANVPALPATAAPPAPVPNTTTQYPVSPLVTDAYPVLTLYSPAVVHAGENVTLKGVTILSPGQALLVEVISASFGPAPKTENTTFFGATGIVHVVKGTRDSENTWEYTFGTEGFAPDTYLVTVTGMTVNVTASSQFVIPG